MSNKVVFITGASRGLGRQMAIEFAQRGYDLALSARNKTGLEALRNELMDVSNVRVEVYTLDASNVVAVQETLPRAATDFGKLDIVVANAGIGLGQAVGKGDFNNTQKMNDLNITGAFATVDTAVRIFKAQGFGQIVGLSSVAAARGLPYNATYSASKAALATYLEGLRIENHGKSITVTVLAPGFIDTDINKDLPFRPFVIPVEKGGKLLVDKIIKKVKHSHVPGMPWSILVPIIRSLPDFLIAKAFR